MEKNKYTPGETISVNIEIPKKLYELINGMAKIANEELKMNLKGEDMMSKLIVQYFGTRNSIDIMTYSLSRLPDLFKENKDDIENISVEFNEIINKLDSTSVKANKLFHTVIDKLENI